MKFGEYLNIDFVKLCDNPLIKTWKDKITLIYNEVKNNQELGNNELFNDETLNIVLICLEMKLAEIYNYDLLYDTNSIYLFTRLNNILSFGIFRLSQQLKYYSTLSNKDLGKEISSNKTKSNNKMSYSGYDLTNQDGAYNNNEVETISSKSDIFGYNAIINKYVKEFADDIKRNIKGDLLKLIW